MFSLIRCKTFIKNSATNLKIWSKSEIIINETIKVFTDMATGYSNSKLIAKLDTIKYIIKNHGPSKFDFLNQAINIKSRTSFYTILTKLLFVDDYNEDDFLNFVGPCKISNKTSFTIIFTITKNKFRGTIQKRKCSGNLKTKYSLQ
jgi:hypothetical protein